MINPLDWQNPLQVVPQHVGTATAATATEVVEDEEDDLEQPQPPLTHLVTLSQLHRPPTITTTTGTATAEDNLSRSSSAVSSFTYSVDGKRKQHKEQQQQKRRQDTDNAHINEKRHLHIHHHHDGHSSISSLQSSRDDDDDDHDNDINDDNDNYYEDDDEDTSYSRFNKLKQATSWTLGDDPETQQQPLSSHQQQRGTFSAHLPPLPNKTNQSKKSSKSTQQQNSRRSSTSRLRLLLRKWYHPMSRYTCINLVISGLLFCTMIGLGIILLLSMSHSQQSIVKQNVIDITVELEDWFQQSLDKAITIPLYTLAYTIISSTTTITTSTSTTTSTTTTTTSTMENRLYDLPIQIGPGYGPGSLPFILEDPTTNSTTTTTNNGGNNMVRTNYRNITGVCDDPHLMEYFDELVTNSLSLSGSSSSSSISSSTIDNHNAVLMNYQLAPMGVICLVHPQLTTTTITTNTEDLKLKDDPQHQDDNDPTVGIVGRDLLVDPLSRSIALATISQDDIVLSGPMTTTLHQCHDDDDDTTNPSKNCHPIQAKALIARFPIRIQTHSSSLLKEEGEQPIFHSPMVVNGVSYPHKWGFVTALIHWDQLLEQSGIYEIFQDRNMEFQLSTSSSSTITDLLRKERDSSSTTAEQSTTTTETEQDKSVVIAESPNFVSRQRGYGVVRTTLHVSTHVMNDWELTVLFPLSGSSSKSDAHYRLAGPLGQWVVLLIVVIWSFGIALFVFSVLQKREIQYQTLIRRGTDQIRVDTERNITMHLAHELGGPLDAVNHALQAMPQEELAGSRSKELVSSLHASVGFLSIVMGNIDQIVTQLGGGEEWNFLHLKRQPLSLDALLRSVHAMVSPLVKPSVDFRVDCLSRPGVNDWVRGDLHRILQIMFNIVSNAIKYTVEGVIVLSVGWESLSFVSTKTMQINSNDDPQDKIPESLTSVSTTAKIKNNDGQQQRQFVKITCSDTGPGISQQDQETIFQRLDERRRGEISTTSSSSSGTGGIGLSITKQIVDSMEGSIRLVSDPSNLPGTRCIVKLPLELWEEQPIE